MAAAYARDQFQPLEPLMHANAYRYDPTRTRPVVVRLERETKRRFTVLKALVKVAIVENDILNGGPLPSIPNLNGVDQRPRVNAAPVLGVLDWFRQAQFQILLGSPYGSGLTSGVPRSWLNPYLQAVYRLALSRAGSHVRSIGGNVTDRWMQRAHMDRVHQLGAMTMYARAYAALENIAMAGNAAALRVLQAHGLRTNAEPDEDDLEALIEAGIAGGRSMTAVAKELSDAFDISYERALTLARTETIATHADATLNAFEEAGMDGVTVDAEFATAGDKQVCERCQELEGRTYSIAEARGVIPVHPRCRCAWLPVVQPTSGVLR